MAPAGSRFRRYTLTVIGVGIPLTYLALFFIWPTLHLITRGLGAAGGGLGEVISRERTWRVLANTVLMAGVATFIAIVLGLFGAHVFYRLRFPGYRFARAALMIPFVLPSVVVGIAFAALFAPGAPLGFLGLMGSKRAIIAGMVFFNYPLAVKIIGSAWARLDPRPGQVAATLGATPWQTWRKVTFPSLLHAIASAASLIFLFCSSAYGLVRVLGSFTATTLEAEIYAETAQYLNLNAAAGLSIIQIMLILIVLGIAALARRGKASNSHPKIVLNAPSRTDIPAILITVGVCLVLEIAPLATLLIRAFRKAGEWTLSNFTNFVQHNPILGGSLLQATMNSIFIALISTVISVIMGSIVAILLSRRTQTRLWSWAQSVLDAIFMLPLGVSAVTVGFGMLLTVQAKWLGASWWVVVFAQSVVALPLVVRNVLPALRGVEYRQLQAAASLGASPWKVFTRIEFPYMWNGVKIGIGFALAVSLGEFGATSFLARPDTPTLPVGMFTLMSRPSATDQGTAMAGAVVLALTCAAVITLAEYQKTRIREVL